MTTLRLPYYDIAPELTNALRSVGELLEHSALGIRFIELLYMRVSQINGCEFCLRLHGRKLVAAGESEERVEAIEQWRTSILFNDKERAALNWAESLTKVNETYAPNEDYAPLKECFSDQEITELTFAIVSMNALNRLAIGMRRAS